MNRLKERVEVCANVSIIILALVLGALLLKGQLLPSISHGSASVGDRISPGTKLSLADVDFAKKGKTLLLALAKGCHFCSESAPFYRRLAQEVSESGNVQLFFVFPHRPDEGKNYLDGLDISSNILSDQVKQADFRALGIKGSPTLILADNNGQVTDVWLGKLQSSEEEEVLAKVKPCVNCN